MCVSFCPVRRCFFWNHEDCDGRDCEFTAGPHGLCATCRHVQDETCTQAGVCALTNAPLPETGGCCQHDAMMVSGLVEVSWDMLVPLRIRPEEMIEQFLQDYDVPYQRGPQGEVMVDPDDLALPRTFGIGTEHVAEEDLDWSVWAAQWGVEEIEDEALSGEFPR